MALKIFDLEDAPKPSTNASYGEALVGKLKGGYQEDGLPVATETIVVTTDDPAVAERASELFGGDVVELDVDKGHDHRVVTDQSEIKLLVSSTRDFSTRFALYGQGGLLFATDGETILEGEDFTGATEGQPWGGRPASIEAWKNQAKSGRAPKPDIRLRGRLADDPELGVFQYQTSGWSLVADVPAIETQLEEALEAANGGSVLVSLIFQRREIKKGPMKGKAYTRASIRVHGPAN